MLPEALNLDGLQTWGTMRLDNSHGVPVEYAASAIQVRYDS